MIRNLKTAEVYVLFLSDVDYKLKLIRRGKEGHHILVKGPTHQEQITIINTYALNTQHTPSITGHKRSSKHEYNYNVRLQ